MACHGADRKGNPPQIPALADLDLQPARRESGHYREDATACPRSRNSGDAELAALAAYVSQPACRRSDRQPHRAAIHPRRLHPRSPMPRAFPAISPPWGTLNAIDLVTGNILWKVPLGEYPELAAKGIHNTGTMNFGGAVGYSRQACSSSPLPPTPRSARSRPTPGRVLWESQLPAGGYATPSVYMVNGREYVAIAAGGGGKDATKSGDSVVAFALAREGRSAAHQPS